LELHPAGKIPVLDDDGFVIFESNTTNRYLAQKYQSALYPDDLQKRAVIDEWVDFVTQHVEAALNRVLTNRFMVKVIDFIEYDERSLQDGLVFLERSLPVINDQLKRHTFLAGDQLSLADLNLLAIFDSLELAQVDVSAYTAIVPWRAQLKQHDFYQQCFKDYNDLFVHMNV
jgi:glutathione S-transferase